tara:strand:+ start:762 stop:1250 length:489 start_codon:yes stop_codon:yes gene_type:complete
MKIPKNMTREQVMDKIQLVINRIAPKYTFNGYEVDDIKQESFLICLDALNRYDQKRPLENFLSVNLSNRLKNFIRDNNFTKSDEEKRKVLVPNQLSNEYAIEDTKYSLSLENSEIINIIDKELPIEYRSDYLKIMNDVHVSKKRKDEIVSIIQEILEGNKNG